MVGEIGLPWFNGSGQLPGSEENAFPSGSKDFKAKQHFPQDFGIAGIEDVILDMAKIYPPQSYHQAKATENLDGWKMKLPFWCFLGLFSGANC